ncbi:MAG: cell surface protein SprA, partial [Candidatus Zixiibacteriota bacterium]
AQYDWSDDLKFGTTVLYKSDKAQDRKPRVGQETAKATVYDFDMTLRLHPDFLTKAVDALPLISTEAKSNMQISGELAQSRPNPNVNGDAFIDDFESASEQVSLGLTRTTWHKASMPLQLRNAGPYTRGKMLWYEGNFLNWEDVYNSQKSAGEGILTPMRIIFRPNNNHRFDSQGNLIDDRPPPGSTNWWAGITRYFGGRLDAKRLQLFEMRVKTSGRKGILHIDFGRISEDVNGDGTDNTEDLNGNDAVEPEEDLGLDGLPDALEDTANYDPETNPDPNGDNWFFEGVGNCPLPASLCNNTAFVDALKDSRNPLYYEWINGTEGNRDDFEFLLEPDEERLSNSSFNTTDAYFSFEIDLSDPNSPFLVPSSEHNGWVTYRIPIRDSSVYTVHEAGENAKADWTQVTHARIWFEANGLEEAYDTLDIAGWYFVQTNWQDSLISSSDNARFVVASVSEDQDANYKNSGIPYAPYVDPTSRIEEPRSALQFLFQDLAPRDTGFVTKDLVTAESYSGYRRLAMYVYAADSIVNDSVDLFFRLGQDSANFYEYRTRLVPGWAQSNWVDINFNDITAIKDSALRALGDPRAALDVTSGKYRIFGRPNLNQIRFFAAGVINQGSFPVSGEVWIDELRVTDVRDDPGVAVRADVTGSLADLITYNASVEHRDPFFRGLSTATRGGGVQNLGSGRTDNRYNYGVTLNFDRFLPRSWGARIPVSFSYSKSEQIPLVRTNSDIVIPPEVRREEISTSESRNVRVSESFRKAG